MIPTLEVGQRVLVNRIGNTFNDPKVGEIVVFHPPAGADSETCGAKQRSPTRRARRPTPQKASSNFIKRIVAGPGDTISISGGHVVLNGKLQKEPFIAPCGDGAGCNLPRAITIPPDHYFMMGDNRGESDDSRFWGPVPRKWIIGGAFATYWPPKRIGIL